MKHIQIRNSDMAWHIAAKIWDNFHEKCTDSWCWRSDSRHVINQLADKQTIKQTLFARSQQKSTNPIQLIKCKQLPAKSDTRSMT